MLAAVTGLGTGGLGTDARLVAATAALMAAWWMTEAIPMWATALVPFLFPIAGIGTAAGALSIAWNPLILLFVGGMTLARGMETTGLHRRVALHVIALVGATPRRLVLGVMISGAAISLFVSNSATALMLYPIVLALVERAVPEGLHRRALGAAAMLGLAYGVNIGGAGCLIGSPANLVAIAPLQKVFPEAPPIGFVPWLGMGLPLVILFVPVAWIYLVRIAFRLPVGGRGEGSYARQEVRALGRLGRSETFVALIFAACALAWMTQELWKKPAGLRGAWSDTTVALAGATVLLLVPVGPAGARTAVTPRDVARLPWGLLLVIAGGLALSGAFETSGLTRAIGETFQGASGLSPLLLVAATSFSVVALTALTSNTGTAGVVAPILAASAPALGVDPRLLLLPAALAVSCDFALPVGTPPNAIVFGSGYLTLGKMARTGVVMDLFAAGLIVLVTFAFACPVFGISPAGGVPSWAQR